MPQEQDDSGNQTEHNRRLQLDHHTAQEHQRPVVVALHPRTLVVTLDEGVDRLKRQRDVDEDHRHVDVDEGQNEGHDNPCRCDDKHGTQVLDPKRDENGRVLPKQQYGVEGAVREQREQVTRENIAGSAQPAQQVDADLQVLRRCKVPRQEAERHHGQVRCRVGEDRRHHVRQEELPRVNQEHERVRERVAHHGVHPRPDHEHPLVPVRRTDRHVVNSPAQEGPEAPHERAAACGRVRSRKVSPLHRHRQHVLHRPPVHHDRPVRRGVQPPQQQHERLHVRTGGFRHRVHHPRHLRLRRQRAATRLRAPLPAGSRLRCRHGGGGPLRTGNLQRTDLPRLHTHHLVLRLQQHVVKFLLLAGSTTRQQRHTPQPVCKEGVARDRVQAGTAAPSNLHVGESRAEERVAKVHERRAAVAAAAAAAAGCCAGGTALDADVRRDGVGGEHEDGAVGGAGRQRHDGVAGRGAHAQQVDVLVDHEPLAVVPGDDADGSALPDGVDALLDRAVRLRVRGVLADYDVRQHRVRVHHRQRRQQEAHADADAEVVHEGGPLRRAGRDEEQRDARQRDDGPVPHRHDVDDRADAGDEEEHEDRPQELKHAGGDLRRGASAAAAATVGSSAALVGRSGAGRRRTLEGAEEADQQGCHDAGEEEGLLPEGVCGALHGGDGEGVVAVQQVAETEGRDALCEGVHRFVSGCVPLHTPLPDQPRNEVQIL
eukprot:Rhum_TRINITY_DN8743_c0_g1::Rhum_TRINITY_DN8743_c0_g1_i1::g.29692::m.29692